MPLVGLQFVVVVFPGHTHLPFGISHESTNKPYLQVNEHITKGDVLLRRELSEKVIC